ncbi:MAG: DUF5317 family protein [Acidobacteria bacterium]|nr:DUF5317 family protein [Acidobacteriota bacterium]
MLLLVAIATALAILVGALAGGRIGGLAAIHLRASPLALGSLAFMVLGRIAQPPGAAGHVVVVAGYALAAAFLAANISPHRGALRLGIAVLALGWGLNAAVIVSNGGMPLSLAAHYSSGETLPPSPGEGGFFKIVVAGAGTRLRPLGDIIPIRPLRKVASPGDLVLMLGMGIVVAAGMRERAEEPAGETQATAAPPAA